MAKAKKSTDETESTPATPEKKAPAAKKKAPGAAVASAAEATPAPAAKAPAAAATAKKPAAVKSGSGISGFGIDTNLAAQSAARMLLNRPSANAPTSTSGGTAKHLKDSMNKSSSGIGNLLGGGPVTGGKSSNLPHMQNQQKGRNQATGHVGNTGVPRRTPG